MKHLFFILLCLGSLTAMAQIPQSINYQGVARDQSGNILSAQSVGIEFTVIQNSTPVYSETHTATTNQFGLFNLQIGEGTTTDVFSTIDWSAGNLTLQVGMDATGGTTYAVMGTQQLITVPYAFHSENSGSAQALNNYPVATTPPQIGQVLRWDGNNWIPVTLEAPTTNNSLVYTADGF